MKESFKIYRTNGLTRKTDCVGSYSNNTFTAGSVIVKDVANVYAVQTTTKVMLNGRPCLAVEVYITTEGTLCRVLIGGSEEVYPTIKKETVSIDDFLEVDDNSDEEEMP